MRLRGNVYAFYEPVYGFTIHLIAPCSHELLDKYVKSHREEPMGPDTWTARCVDVPKKSLVIVALKEWEGRTGDVAHLVHELFHAVRLIMHRRSIPLRNSSEEAWAYLLDHLVETSLNWLYKRDKLKRGRGKQKRQR